MDFLKSVGPLLVQGFVHILLGPGLIDLWQGELEKPGHSWEALAPVPILGLEKTIPMEESPFGGSLGYGAK